MEEQTIQLTEEKTTKNQSYYYWKGLLQLFSFIATIYSIFSLFLHIFRLKEHLKFQSTLDWRQYYLQLSDSLILLPDGLISIAWLVLGINTISASYQRNFDKLYTLSYGILALLVVEIPNTVGNYVLYYYSENPQLSFSKFISFQFMHYSLFVLLCILSFKNSQEYGDDEKLQTEVTISEIISRVFSIIFTTIFVGSINGFSFISYFQERITNQRKNELLGILNISLLETFFEVIIWVLLVLIGILTIVNNSLTFNQLAVFSVILLCLHGTFRGCTRFFALEIILPNIQHILGMERYVAIAIFSDILIFSHRVLCAACALKFMSILKENVKFLTSIV